MGDWLPILRTLVGFPTVSADSNMALIEWVRDYLAGHGVEAHLTFDAAGRKANLFATVVPGDGGLILSGHTDVVPVTGQQWSSDPFAAELRDGRVYGRGTCDMKGFIAVALALVPEMRALDGARPLHLALSYDEELGCRGAPRMIDDLVRRGVRAGGCIVGEPTGMKAIIGHKGAGMYRCTVTGRAAHSSLAPTGVNAIEYAACIVMKLREIGRRLEAIEPRHAGFDVPYSTIQVNRIDGGTAGNIVADRCEFRIDIRHLPATDRAALIAEVAAHVADELLPEMRLRAPEAAISIEEVADIPPFEIAADASLVREVVRSNSVEGACGHVAFGSEAGLFQRAGIPTVICGPGSIEQAHRPDEFVAIEQLERCDGMLRTMLGTVMAEADIY
ncbi:acetylornithine deacetylase [Rhizorhabdus wittichii]|uniref:Acetylornithine deacetylase n=1 Tax=Rhizorhabdus wittichii TaxID=160791 RepID=A0A975D8S1_9SPHN|nr:acetylornithine deacetylase [Rhizorhabdus wittichii]QTH23830.1 acetylornithine deacetylase [Rhizorhabdus wittichii]